MSESLTPPPPPASAVGRRTSKKAIAAFVFVLLGLILGLVGAVAGIVLAILAKRDMRKTPSLRGRALANVALVAGIVLFAVQAFLVYAVVMPALPGGREERVVHFHLGGTLQESPGGDIFGTLLGQPSTLYSLLKRIKDAKEDPAVKAVVITASNLQIGLSEMEELRAALVDFQSSGKRVHAYCDDQLISMPLYLTLASATRLSVMPMALLNVKGLYAQAIYLKDGLDKIGVAADVVQAGDYKAAGEMLARSEPSPAASENMNWLLDGLYQSCVNKLAESRHKTVDEVKALIDVAFFTTEQALKDGLVDALERHDEFVDTIRKEYGEEIFIDNNYRKVPAPDIHPERPLRSLLNLIRYFTMIERTGPGDCIGLVYLNGLIVTGYGTPEMAFSGDLRAALEEAAEDDSIKAVVLRVDSPGGSATASEVIYHAAQLLQERKPLVVSMGGTAASGGYFVSCGADCIFADETTMTGSIGVIGNKLVVAELWKKLGVNWVPYQRGANADMFSGLHPFTEQQEALFAACLDTTYLQFKEHVTTGRDGKLAKGIDDLAGGRVFTGAQALELGLVDKIGGLQAAIAHAAELALLEDYEVRVVPELKDAAELLMDVFTGELGKSNSDLDTIVHVGAPAAVSADVRAMTAALEGLDPAHARAVADVMDRFGLLNQEGMAMLMPQVLVFQ